MDHVYHEVASRMGGSKSDVPEKKVHHIEIHKSATKGDHVVTHHHTHPGHHPEEKHTTRGDDELAAHVMSTMGTPNPGEGQDESAAPPDAAAAAPAGAAAGAEPNAAAGAPPMAM